MEEEKVVLRTHTPAADASIVNARKAIKKKRGVKSMSKEERTNRQMRVADCAYEMAKNNDKITYAKIGRKLNLDPITVKQIMISQSFEDITKYMGMDDFSIAAVLSNHIYNPDENISLKAIQERNKMVGAYKNIQVDVNMPQEIMMMKEILNPNIIEGEIIEDELIEEDDK